MKKAIIDLGSNTFHLLIAEIDDQQRITTLFKKRIFVGLGDGGIDVLKELKEKNDPLKVLILTVHSEVEYLVQAVDIGANGYILKDSGSEELKKAIQSVMEGDSYIQPSLIPSLNSRLVNRDIDKEKIAALTKREMEILTQISGGMFNKEIAVNLNISERTVKNHISNIFKKIDVSDRTQAAVFAIRNNIVKLF